MSALWFCHIGMQAKANELIEISGMVISSENQLPMVGVNVYMPELKRGTVTDAEGRFTLSVSSSAGNILLQLSYIGYKTQLLRLSEADWQSGLRVVLEAESIMTNEVIVSVGRIASRDEIPVLVDKMSSMQMRSSGEINPMTALTHIPGVEQIAYGTSIGKPVIRGMSFSRILSMYQGSRFENQQWGADHGLGVNDLGIEAVEVIKGPASFLYGSGAVGGVVYMVDERPAPKGQLHADINTTFHSNTLGVRQTVGIKESKSSGWFYGIHAAYENHADYIDGNGRTIGNSRFNTYTLRANTGLQKDWGTVRLAYTFHQQNLGIIEDDELEESLATSRNDRSRQLPFQDIQDHLITAHSVFYWGKGRLESTFGHHINYRKEIEDDLGEVDLGLIQNNSTFDIKYYFDSHANMEHIIGAQGFYLTNENMHDAEEILIPDAQVWDGSLYYLGTLRKAKTTFQAGLRYDSRNTIGDATAPLFVDYGYSLPGFSDDTRTSMVNHNGLSGSVGFIHQWSKPLILKSNFSSGFRAPDLAELFSNGEHPGTQRFEIGDIHMKREQNFQWDIAFQYQSRYFNIEISPFINFISNYVYFTPTDESVAGTDLVVWRFEQSNARLYGGEAYVKWHPLSNGRISVASSYSMVRGINPDNKDYMPLMPADRINSSLTFRLPQLGIFKKSDLRIQHQWVMQQNRLSPSESAAYEGNTTPAFHLIGASLGSEMIWGKQPVRVNVSANNLLNVAYLDHLSFLRPFMINNMGRNISVNIALPIVYKRD